MTITALPTPPTRSDPVNFVTRADTFLTALPLFATEANALAVQVNLDASGALSSSDAAAASAITAQAASTAAQSSGNYKGEWSSLTGALTIPSTVSYNNQVYILTVNIADVTANTPGVSSVWLLQGLYDPVTPVSSNITAQVFRKYRVTANCVITLPATPVDGQWIDFIDNTAGATFTVDRNGKTIMATADNLVADKVFRGFRIQWLTSADTWILFI